MFSRNHSIPISRRRWAVYLVLTLGVWLAANTSLSAASDLPPGTIVFEANDCRPIPVGCIGLGLGVVDVASSQEAQFPGPVEYMDPVGAAQGPAWSPDGTSLAFYSDILQPTSFDYRVWVTDAAGSKSCRLSDIFGQDPAWSPDGRQIAFTGEDGIMLANADGTSLHELIHRKSVGHPAWSPDGKHLVFNWEDVSPNPRRGGPFQLYTLDIASKHLRRLTNTTEDFTDPAWSPDGKTIAFTSVDDQLGTRIFLINPDGSALRRIRPLDGGDYPAWSPDGRYIALTLHGQIYIAYPDGSHLRQVTHSDTEKFHPSWRPFGKDGQPGLAPCAANLTPVPTASASVPEQ